MATRPIIAGMRVQQIRNAVSQTSGPLAALPAPAPSAR